MRRGEGGDLGAAGGSAGRAPCMAKMKSRQAASYSAFGTAHSVRRLASRSAFSCQAATRSRNASTPGLVVRRQAERPGADQRLVEHELRAHRPAPAPSGRSLRSGALQPRPALHRRRPFLRDLGQHGEPRARHPRRACGRASRWPAGRAGSSCARARRRGVEAGRRDREAGRDRSRPRCARSAGRSGRRRCPRRSSPPPAPRAAGSAPPPPGARAAAPAAGCAAARRRASASSRSSSGRSVARTVRRAPASAQSRMRLSSALRPPVVM